MEKVLCQKPNFIKLALVGKVPSEAAKLCKGNGWKNIWYFPSAQNFLPDRELRPHDGSGRGTLKSPRSTLTDAGTDTATQRDEHWLAWDTAGLGWSLHTARLQPPGHPRNHVSSTFVLPVWVYCTT